MLGKTSWYSIDVDDRHILFFYKKFYFCHLLSLAKVGQFTVQWNLVITRSLGSWKLPCYIRFLIISGQRNKELGPANLPCNKRVLLYPTSLFITRFHCITLCFPIPLQDCCWQNLTLVSQAMMMHTTHLHKTWSHRPAHETAQSTWPMIHAITQPKGD